MSVITNLETVPNRLEIVYRVLRDVGEAGIPERDFRQILAPRSLTRSEASPIATSVIQEARRLGIIVLEDGVFRLSPALSSGPTSLLPWFETVLLDPARAEEVGQLNVPYALAWLLEQDPSHRFGFSDNIQELVTTQCGADVNGFELTNSSRFQNLVYWAQYLGFAWRLSLDRGDTVVPDPTRAIERLLSRLRTLGEEFPITDLLDAWAVALPILERGKAREHVIRLLGSAQRRDERTLSRSSSLALRRLADRGLIRLEARADATAFTLDLRPAPQAVSHVVFGRG